MKRLILLFAFLSLLGVSTAQVHAQASFDGTEIAFSIKPFPIMRAELAFRDSSNNAMLEPGESGRILLTMSNRGKGDAGSTHVTLIPSMVPFGVEIHTVPRLHGIGAGGYVTLEIPITATTEAEIGDLHLRAEIRDSSGYLLAETKPHVILVRPVERPAITQSDLDPPDLRIFAFEPDKAFTSKDTLGEVIFTTASALLLRGMATDSSGVVAVKVNGIEAHATPREDGMNFRKDLLLVWGDNVVEVEALDPFRNTSRKTLRIRRVPEQLAEGEGGFEFADMKKKQVFAIVIGISKYANPNVRALKYADKDARSFADYLHTPIAKGGRGVPLENVKLLLNEAATEDSIRDALFEWPKRTVPDDIFFIYFAGHGQPDPIRSTEYYFLPYNADPHRLGGTAIRQSEIKYAVERYIGADIIVGFFDACHGAAVSDQIARRDASADSGDVKRFLYEVASAKPGVLLFSASEVYEVSFEAYRWGNGHGVFTYHLIEGLKGRADQDEDNFVLLGELVDYVTEQVQRDTENQQHPMKLDMGFDRKIPMSLVIPRE